MAQDLSGGVAGVPASEAREPLVAHDAHKPTMSEKVKLTLANAKERINPHHAWGGGGSSNPATPTAAGAASNTASPTSPSAFFTPTGTAGSPTERKAGTREVHPPCSDGGRVGDVDSPRTSGAIPRREGAPASPKVPHKDWGERIYEKLPFSHVNPYSVGHPVERPSHNSDSSSNPYVSGSAGTDPTAPGATTASTTSSPQEGPKLMSKIKNLVTGQKPAQGAATENATINTPALP